MSERIKRKLCPVRLCTINYQTKDGLRAHLYTKHSKVELLETLKTAFLLRPSKASLELTTETIKSRVVEALLSAVCP